MAPLAYKAISPNAKTGAKPLSELMRDALNGMEAVPVGESPAEVDTNNCHVWCNTLKKYITSSKALKGCDVPNGETATDQQANDFVKRLDGRTVQEELTMAGLMPKKSSSGTNGIYPDAYFGDYKVDDSLAMMMTNSSAITGICFKSYCDGDDKKHDIFLGNVLLNNGTYKKGAVNWAVQQYGIDQHHHSVIWFETSAE